MQSWLRRRTLIVGIFLLPAAQAGTINFTLSGGDSGSFAITETAGTITNISGTFDGSAILALLPLFSIGGNDNVYTGTSPYFDPSGVSFSLATPDSYGYIYVNLSDAANLPTYAFGSCQGNSLATCNGITGFSPVRADTILVATPEPGSVTLLAFGLIALIGIAGFRPFAKFTHRIPVSAVRLVQGSPSPTLTSAPLLQSMTKY